MNFLIRPVVILAAVAAALLFPVAFRALSQEGGEPPSVTIVSPIDGAVVINTNDLIFTVEADSPDGSVARVALYRDGQFLGQALASPYLFNLVNPAAGANVYTAVATDDHGHASVSDPVTVFVEAPLPPYYPPTVTLASSTTNLVLTAPATFSLTAFASVYRDGLDRFDVQAVYEPLGPTPVVAGEGRLNPSTVTLSNLAVGHYVFSVVVRDIFGGMATSSEVAVTVLPPATVEVPRFRLIDLGVLGGEESSAVAINGVGAVVGTSTVAPGSGEQRAFLWQSGVLRDIPFPDALSYGLGLNDRGHVVGSLGQGGRLAGAFLWTPTAGLTVLPILGSQAEAFALNTQGSIVGWSGGPSGGEPVAWNPGSDSDPLPGMVRLSPGRYGQARAINDSGQIAGSVAEGQFSPSRAVLWENGVERDLRVAGALGGERSQALGISASGQVVGRVALAAPVQHGFLWEDGVVHELMPLVGSSGWATAVNDQGWSVGVSKPDNNFIVPPHAVLWLDRIPFDLNTLVTNLNEAVLLGADAVNNRGQIVGTAFIGGQRHAYLLTPTTLTASQVPPAVELANPQPGTTVAAGKPVALLASVNPAGDAIARVDFYSGHSVVATAYQSPYAATWRPTTKGDVCLRAVAVDIDGYAAASGTTCITVLEAPPRYGLADLGELATREARASGINSAGDFVGQARTEQGDVGFLFRGGIITYLKSPAPRANQALDINDSGQVVVWDNGRAGIYQDGAITFLKQFPAGSPSSLGRAINNAGSVVGEGSTDNHETHAALYFGDAVADLGLTLGENSQANAINDAGVVVGWFQSAPGQPTLAFIRQPDGSLLQFGSSFGGRNAQATGINETGTVIGNASDGEDRHHAFSYVNGVMQRLGTFRGFNSFARAINGPGQIVGSADNENSNRRAFLHENGTMTDLNRLLTNFTTAILTEAVAINGAGQILANGNAGPENPTPRIFLLNPLHLAGQSNQPPTVSVQLPVEREVHYEGDSIPLLASAKDQDGAVALVLFSSGTNSLGSVAHPPYAVTWSNVEAGTYPVTATAFDNLGGSRTSAPVSLTIRAFNPTAPRVAIIGAAPDAHQADIRRHLRRTELFSRVDILGPLPTPAQLGDYDSVLVHSETATPLPTDLGDLLADYVDAGHGIALALYASDASRPVIQGRLLREGYLTWTNEQISSHGHAIMLKDLPDHPILAGVASFDGGPSAVYAHEMTLAPGSLVVASWETHHPLAVARELGAGRLVGLNLNPLSGAVTSLGWDTNSDGARLLGNSLIWAASAPSNRISLVTASTNQNAYLPGEPVILTADSADLPGEGIVQFYSDGILLGSVTNLPAKFTWTNAPVGNHLIVAVYSNMGGRLIGTPGVPVTVDSRLTIELVTPANGAVYYLPTNILMQVTLADRDASVVRVDYYLDGSQRLGSVTSPPFAFDFKLLPTGTFSFSAVAIDALGARRISPAHVVTIVNSALPQRTDWMGFEGNWTVLTNWTAGPPRSQDSAMIDGGIARIDTQPAVAAHLVVGRTAMASLVTAGASLNVGRQLMVGENSGSSGNFRLEAPGILAVDEFVLGLQGNGAAVQNGGIATANQLILSGNTGGTGIYELNGGVLETGNGVVAGNGIGRFVQRGGTHSNSMALHIGLRNGSWGTYQLSGGRLVTRIELIGASGSNPENLSTLLQTGGTHQVLEELRVGEAGASGRLSVFGGELRARRLTLDSSWLDLMADPSTNRLQVSGSAQLGGVLGVQLAAGYSPLGGDAITLMTYGSRQGAFTAVRLPPSTNGVVWSLEYGVRALVLRALPPPQVVIVSPITASPQPGLFQQTVTLSNLGTEPLQGSRIYFPGLPPGWQLYNSAGTEEGVPYVEVDSIIAPNSSTQFTVQFLIPGETRPARQNYVVRLGDVADAGAPTRPLHVEQTTRRTDEAMQLQFTSGRNQTYRIEYSDNLLDWREVPQPVVAAGGKTQWVDDGPPKTVSRPGQELFRFYRIIGPPIIAEGTRALGIDDPE